MLLSQQQVNFTDVKIKKTRLANEQLIKYQSENSLPFGELVKVAEQVRDSDSVSRRLRSVSRTDSFLGGSKLGFTLRSFGLL
jgi:hypothetical protein